MEIVVVSVKLMLGFESSKVDPYNPSYGLFSRTATDCPILVEPTIQFFGTDFRLGKSTNLD